MVQERNIAMCIVFSIITCGLYGIYWFIKLTDETNQLLNDTESASGAVACILTIVTCNIYGWYWSYKMGEKVDALKGTQGGSSSILFIVLQALGLGIVNYCLIQDAINNAAAGPTY